jgi:hypothetical protein
MTTLTDYLAMTPAEQAQVPQADIPALIGELAQHDASSERGWRFHTQRSQRTTMLNCSTLTRWLSCSTSRSRMWGIWSAPARSLR